MPLQYCNSHMSEMHCSVYSTGRLHDLSMPLSTVTCVKCIVSYQTCSTYRYHLVWWTRGHAPGTTSSSTSAHDCELSTLGIRWKTPKGPEVPVSCWRIDYQTCVCHRQDWTATSVIRTHLNNKYSVNITIVFCCTHQQALLTWSITV